MKEILFLSGLFKMSFVYATASSSVLFLTQQSLFEKAEPKLFDSDLEIHQDKTYVLKVSCVSS